MDIYYYIALVPIIISIVLIASCGIVYQSILKVVPVILFGSLVVTSTTYLASKPDETDKTLDTSLECSSDFYSNLVLLHGDTDHAIDLILEDIAINGETAENITSLARAKALADDFTASKGLYQKAKTLSKNAKNFPQDEYDAVLNKINFTSDEDFIDFIETEWVDYDYSDLNLEINTEEVLSYDKIGELIAKNIQDDVDDTLSSQKGEQGDYYKELADAFTSASELEDIYEEFLNNKYVENDEISTQIKKNIAKIEDIIEKSKHFKKFEFLRLKLIKGLIVINKTEEVIDVLIDGSVSDKILLSELFLKSYLKEKDFTSTHFEKLEESQVETDDILVLLKENIDTDEEEIDKSELAEIYFQKSKIDFILGDSESADLNMEQALDNAEVSSNVNLSQSLIGIKDYLENDDLSDIDRIEIVENASQSIAKVDLPDNYSETIDFAQELQNYASMKQASITISRIDAENFTKISATFSINSGIADTAEKLRDLINVYDCGDEITDYTLEKIDFANAYTILLSDTSGSMVNSIGDLRNAVVNYSYAMDGQEYVSVSAFSDNIDFIDPFTTIPSSVASSAQKIKINGGTNIYGSILSVFNSFPASGSNISNNLIVMTDGMEYNSTSKNDIYSNLSSLSAEKNINIFTMGLGLELDSQYLTTMARVSGGKYINITSSQSLADFYVFLNQQINNQYIITYEAKNELLNNRELHIGLIETSEQDTKSYTLYDEFANNESYDNLFSLNQDGINVSNLDTNIIYKGSDDIRVLLYGNGFEETQDVLIKLEGTTEQNIVGTYLSPNVIEFYVPFDTEIGLYSVSVYIDWENFYLKNVLSVLEAGRETVFRFGEYVYVATYITEGDGYANLGGNVVMNNWLNFNGNIKIYGDKDRDYSLSVEDLYGSKIILERENSFGLAWALSCLGIQIPMDPFNTHTIYRETDNMSDKNYGEDYQPSEIKGHSIHIPAAIKASVTTELYHDHLEFKVSGAITPIFPEQDKVITIDGSSFEVSSSNSLAFYINSQQIGLIIDLDNSIKPTNDLAKQDFYALIPINLQTFKIKIDTLRNDYYLNLKVGLKHMPSIEPNIELNIEGGEWDKVMMGIDYSIPFTIGSIPSSVSNFKLGLTDIKTNVFTGDLLTVLTTGRVTTALDLGIFDVASYVPHLRDYFDLDAKLFLIKDITANFPSFRQLSYDLNATAVLLGLYEVGSASLTLGEMTYSSAILGDAEIDTVGYRIAHNKGVDIDLSLFGIYVDGAKEGIASTNYIGFQASGAVDMFINFFMSASLSGQGDVSFAIYKYNDSDNYQFTIMGRMKDSISGKDERIRYDWNKTHSLTF